MNVVGRAAIGLVDRKLISKLNRSKHVTGGSRMARVRMFASYVTESLEFRAPRIFCPVRRLWPAITRITRAGEKLFPDWKARKGSEGLRTFVGPKSWKGREKMGAQFPRRGAARAILVSGGPFLQLIRAAQWHLSAYESYLGPGHEESRAIALALLEAFDDDH